MKGEFIKFRCRFAKTALILLQKAGFWGKIIGNKNGGKIG